ncbi:MAG: alpha/beta hydrolase [Candidatus Hodarchaeota archaeon]
MKNSYKNIMPGAGPFYFEGNKTGVLMIHGGGGGTCADLKPLAEDINRKIGCTIHVPLLPGYGTTPEDLMHTTIPEWKEKLDIELKSLRKKCEKVFVGGHSFGGILTLILASKYDLEGIFTINAALGINMFALGLKGLAIFLIPLVRLFKKYNAVDSETLKKETKGKWIGYDKIPLNLVPKVKKLMKEAKKSLHKIECPVILFQGRKDSMISPSSMEFAFDKINSRTKRKVWLENSDHPILDIPDHDLIVNKLTEFINEFNS